MPRTEAGEGVLPLAEERARLLQPPSGWSGEEPEDLWDPDVAEELGAVWEGDELLTYDLEALERQMVETDDEEFLTDVD